MLILMTLYLLMLLLVAAWSDISEDFYKDGHWFGDAVLLLFWDAYVGFCSVLYFFYRRTGLPGWLANLPQTLTPEFVRRAGAHAYFRREVRRKGGAK